MSGSIEVRVMSSMSDLSPDSEPEKNQSQISESADSEEDGGPENVIFGSDDDESQEESEEGPDQASDKEGETEEVSEDESQKTDTETESDESGEEIHDPSQAGAPETQRNKAEENEQKFADRSISNLISDDVDTDELEGHLRKVTYTVKFVSPDNFGINVAETGDWLNFDSDISALNKDEVSDKLTELWDNGQGQSKPVTLLMVNKGTETSPELRWIDFEQGAQSSDWTPADIDEDDRVGSSSSSSGGDSRSAGDNDLSASATYDQAMQALKQADGVERFSVTTSEPEKLDDIIFVRATVEIQPAEGQRHKHQGTGTNSDDDGVRELSDSAVEVAETRAVKRAIRNSGVLLDG